MTRKSPKKRVTARKRSVGYRSPSAEAKDLLRQLGDSKEILGEPPEMLGVPFRGAGIGVVRQALEPRFRLNRIAIPAEIAETFELSALVTRDGQVFRFVKDLTMADGTVIGHLVRGG